MILRQAFKFEIEPDGAQRRLASRTAGCNRFVQNKALVIQRENYAAGGSYIRYEQMAEQLVQWKREEGTSWLKEVPSHTLQQGLKNLHQGYLNLFKGLAKAPTFKVRGKHDSFRFPDPKQFEVDEANARIFLPKFGWIRYRKTQKIEGRILSITVSRKAGRWYASISTECTVPDPVHPSTLDVGLDLGVEIFAATSDAQLIFPVFALERHAIRLARYQRRMAKKQRHSKNYNKAKLRVQKVHQQIANIRADYLHKVSHEISEKYSAIVVEDLKIKNMTASARGTVESPGKNVRAKSCMNRAILNQGWGMFRVQLEYKLKRKGGMLFKVPPHYTSQTCPACKLIAKENRKTRDKFECVACGYKNHADIVGAINVLERGRSLISLWREGLVPLDEAETHRDDCAKAL